MRGTKIESVVFDHETRIWMSQNGIEALPIVFILRFAKQLHLDGEGRQRLESAVEALNSYPASEESLSFGYSRTSVPSGLIKVNGGLTIVAISAALSEVFHEDYTAQVLYHFLLKLSHDRETTPPLQSWSNIAKSCAGTLAMTPFGKIAEDFMRYHETQTDVFTSGNHRDFDGRCRTRSSADSMAEALVNLIGAAKRESPVTIEGGADTGFLAAVAEWLFDLKIVITNEHGTLKYTSPYSGPKYHARFILQNRTPRSSQNSKRDIVQLKDVSRSLVRNDQGHELVVCGRVQWKQCLSASFSPAFQALLEIIGDGNALGSAARIFEAISNAESGVDFTTRKNWIYYSDAGSGLGYIQNLVHRFPELEAVESKAHAAANCTFEEALGKYESAIAVIANACRCIICDGTETNSARRHCYVLVLETILRAALTLSNVSVEPDLLPKMSGFQRLYERQTKARPSEIDARKNLQKGLGPAVWVIEPEREDARLYTVAHRVRLMIDGGMGLFTHLRELENSTSCAWSRNGICAYRDILKNFCSGTSLSQIHIIPGRIGFRGQIVDEVEDWNMQPEKIFRLDNGDGLLDSHELKKFSEPSLRMEQRLGPFGITYQLRNHNQHLVNIPPTYVANKALQIYGLFNCRCLAPTRSLRVGSCYQVSTYLSKEVAIYQAPNDHSLFAILVLATDYFVLFDDKCIECALRTIVLEVQSTTVDNDGDVEAKLPPLLLLALSK